MFKTIHKSIKVYRDYILVLLSITFYLPIYSTPWMGDLTQVYFQKSVKKDKLKITFKEIISDSRCPVGAQCITAGTVKILLKIGNKKTEVQLGNTAKLIYKNHNYQIQFLDMRPYRVKDKEYNTKESYIYLKIVEIKSTP